MKKLTLTFAVMLLALTGCSTSTEPSDDPTQVNRKEQLVIYSNSASDGRSDWLVERAAQEGFNIEVVSIPAGELTNRLIAEKNNSLADMVYGLNSIEYEKLKNEDLLLKYEPTWASEVDMTLGDKEGFYYPIIVQPLVLMMNNEMENQPKDWIDLIDEQYTDQYNIFSLGGGTGKTVFASIISRYPDPNGELGISEEGWDIGKKYIQNGHFEIKGEDYVGALIDGSRPMSMMWGSGVIQHQEERDYAFDIMTPEIGVPYVVEQVAIISKTNKSALAIEFANWFGSAEIQTEWSQKFGSIPAHPEALEAASQEVKDFMSKVHAQELDWGLIAENLDMWVEKAELEFIK